MGASRCERARSGGSRGTYVKVLGVNLLVLREVEVLLGDEDTLAEEVLVDLLAVGLGNQPNPRTRAISTPCSEFLPPSSCFPTLREFRGRRALGGPSINFLQHFIHLFLFLLRRRKFSPFRPGESSSSARFFGISESRRT